MDKRIGRLFICCGILLMLSAGCLHLFNRAQNLEAGSASANLLTEIKTDIGTALPAPTEVRIPSMPEETAPASLGYLSIPALELELPVLTDWDYEKLKQAPCRFSGSLWEDNLVVMAHNYDHHFGNIASLSPGDGVYFTDSSGLCVPFQVASTDILSPTAVAEVVDNAYDLTLFTCTYGGKNRVVIYCEKVPDTEKVPDGSVRHFCIYFRLYSSIS